MLLTVNVNQVDFLEALHDLLNIFRASGIPNERIQFTACPVTGEINLWPTVQHDYTAQENQKLMMWRLQYN